MADKKSEGVQARDRNSLGVCEHSVKNRMVAHFPMFRELDRGQRVFSGLVGWSESMMPNVEVSGVFALSNVLAVTSNFYFELGATPLLGRLAHFRGLNPHYIKAFDRAVLEAMQRMQATLDVLEKSPATVQQIN